MGSIRAMSQAQILQYERDQQAPEWLGWLAGMDAAINRFLGEDAPQIGALPDPWSSDGLRLAGDAARAMFTDRAALSLPEHEHVVDRFVRYIGQVYVQNLEGEWHNVPPYDREGCTVWPVISLPFWMTDLDPRKQLGLAFVRGTRRIPLRPEGELARTFANSREDYDEWVNGGRLLIDEWIEARHRL